MRVLPRPTGETFLSWYNAGVFILWPPIRLLTKQDWRGTDRLGVQGDGMVLAVNHISWFDPFALAHFINDSGRSVRLLAKDSVFDVPIGGQILKGTKQIPVYRGTGDAAAAVDAAVEAVESGECVAVYPEGTITRDPDLWPMSGKSGAARIALRTRKPVIPVAQWGAHEVMAPYRLELNVVPRKTMHFWTGEPVDLSDLYDAEPTPEVLGAATNRIMDAITSVLSEIRGVPAPDERWDLKEGRRLPRGPVAVSPPRASGRRAAGPPSQRARRSTAARPAQGEAEGQR